MIYKQIINEKIALFVDGHLLPVSYWVSYKVKCSASYENLCWFFMVLVVLSKTNISFLVFLLQVRNKRRHCHTYLKLTENCLLFSQRWSCLSVSLLWVGFFICLFVLPFSDCLWTEQLHLDSPPKWSVCMGNISGVLSFKEAEKAKHSGRLNVE